MTDVNQAPTESRTIIAHTLYPKAQNPAHGFLRPLAEIINGELHAVTEDSFCQTMMIFITKNYSLLEEKFPDKQAFKIEVRLSDKLSEFIEPSEACKYVSVADSAEEIKPKDYFQIVSATLPDPNDRTLTLNDIPNTRFIFVDDGISVFGPFKWRKKESGEVKLIQLEFVDSPLPKVSLVPYQVYQIDRATVKHLFVASTLDENNRNIVQGLDILKAPLLLDYASDSEIAKYCLKLQENAGKTIIKRKDADDLVATLSKLQKSNQSVNQKRLQKLPSIIENLVHDQNSVSEWVGQALSVSGVKDFIGDYIENNESRFLEKFKKEKKADIENDLQGLDLKLRESQKKLSSIDDEIKEKNSELQKMKAEMIDNFKIEKYSEEMDSKTAKYSAQLESIENEIEEKKNLLDGLLNIDNIDIRIRSLRDRQKDEEKEIHKLESNKSLLKLEIAQTDADLQKKLANLKPYVDAINGSYFPESGEDRNISVRTKGVPDLGSKIEQQKYVIESIQKGLLYRGRVLEQNEIANLLITTQQSFITVIAGLPGKGKTSLARLLAETQNNRARFQEVAVARGWVSQKDLIGYFNPLTNRFQSANSGLYEFLRALADETDTNRAMAYVLLDEANLSPMEHYWSVFMGMSDGESDAILRLGNESLSIAESLRFMATINYDGTTEPLSSRILDRSPVVVLEKSDLSIIQNGVRDEIESLPISAIEMERLFGKSALLTELSPQEDIAITQIKEVLEDVRAEWGRPIVISPRKQKAIYYYCEKARELLSEYDNDLAAMDFAVLQHVLPQVCGNGKYFAERLKALSQVLKDQTLLQSKAYLDRMIAYGDQDLNSYDFFCW